MPAENRDRERQIIGARQLLSVALIIDHCDAIARIGSARY